MVVVARTVKAAPDCAPQCGVGMGAISSAFTVLSLSREGDVMMVVVSVLKHAYDVYSILNKNAKSMTRAGC